MARKLKSDKLLFLATLLLVCASIVMVYSASAVLALDGQPTLSLLDQTDDVGLARPGGAYGRDAGRLQQLPPTGVHLGLGGGRGRGLGGGALQGANQRNPPVVRHWGIGVQPSEVAKLSAIFFIAALLERRMHRIDKLFVHAAPIGFVVALLAALILLEPDFGTAVSLLAIVSVMVFAAGVRYRYLAGAILAGLPILYILLMSAPYRRRRLMAFWDPWSDPLGDGFQVIQSMIAVGAGGVFGRGLMGGVQKLFYLPEPHTDFIYAVIGEELGLIGATVVLICFLIITWRGLYIAVHAPDRFGAFLALGLTTMIVAQALLNISVTLGMLPTKGIPLPLVSAGGSSLLTNLLGMGILLNVSQHAPVQS